MIETFPASVIIMSFKDSNNDLEEALEAIDLESWLDSEGIDYKVTRGRSGTQIQFRECPECGHDKWKTYANADTGLGKCFVCDQGLNKWRIIKGYRDGLSGRDLVDHIKSFAKTQGWIGKRKASLAVNMDTELKIPTSIELPHGGRNLKYLDLRGITGDIANYFNLRFCHKGTFPYINHDGRRLSQDYSNRVIIPVFDLQGDLVSFQGRDITGTSDRKYLFPPGFASTGTILFNGHNAIGASRIALGEGAFDVAAIKIALDADQNLRDIVAVGTFGKNLSGGDENSQMAKLIYLRDKGLKEVLFIWDGEPAAIVAAVDAALAVRAMGITAKLVILPDGKDPNEIPASVLRTCVYRAITIDKISATKLKMKYSKANIVTPDIYS